MSILSNFRIRTKVLLALLPLITMMLAAGLYSSWEMRRIDRLYSQMIQRDSEVQRALTVARACNNRFGLFLYREFAETDPTKIRESETEIEIATFDFRTAADQLKRSDTHLAEQVDGLIVSFNRLVASAAPVREAVRTNDREKSVRELQTMVEPEWLKTRQGIINLESTVAKNIDEQSNDLTRQTRNTIAVSWILTGVGLVLSFIVTFVIIQVEVVGSVKSFRNLILGVAQGNLNQPITNLDRPNEVGEMSRTQDSAGRSARARNTGMGNLRSSPYQQAPAGRGGLRILHHDAVVTRLRVHAPAIWRSLSDTGDGYAAYQSRMLCRKDRRSTRGGGVRGRSGRPGSSGTPDASVLRG